MKKLYTTLSLAVILASLLSFTATAQNAWINEIHYNDFGTDTNEFIEVVIQYPGMFNLSSFSVVLYNGNNGSSYDTRTLDLFTPGETFEGYVVYYFMYPVNGIQNGDPDGLALVYNDAVIPGQFLSYEGSFVASDGPAAGMTSVDIGVMETGELEGLSLQLSGQGSEYLNFTWQAPADETHGELNNAQDLLPVGIGEYKTLNFSLFPNPNNGEFNLDNPLDETVVMEIHTTSGQLICEMILSPGENILSTTLSKGIYLLSFKNKKDKLLKTGRLVVIQDH